MVDHSGFTEDINTLVVIHDETLLSELLSCGPSGVFMGARDLVTQSAVRPQTGSNNDVLLDHAYLLLGTLSCIYVCCMTFKTLVPLNYLCLREFTS